MWPPNLHLHPASAECDSNSISNSLSITPVYRPLTMGVWHLATAVGHIATCLHSSWTELWHSLTTQMTRNRTIATLSMHLKHPLNLPWRRIYIILSTEIIFSQSIGPAKKNLRLFIEGVKIWTGPLALVWGCMRACFIHGTSKIQNRKSNWICASDLNHWPWDCPVCDFQSKIPSSPVTGRERETITSFEN